MPGIVGMVGIVVMGGVLAPGGMVMAPPLSLPAPQAVASSSTAEAPRTAFAVRGDVGRGMADAGNRCPFTSVGAVPSRSLICRGVTAGHSADWSVLAFVNKP
jgi:hypothetical protein